ncbi:MAG: phosphoribosylformylglycinamidine cyclo-ligase [Spirochaetes bacterium]|nr:phosphoribosylformylglycinamidine cyclo-ligase [Spirochaetota bacterium]
MGLDYKKSGVDIDLASGALKDLKKSIESTFNKNVVQGIGHFGGFYQIDDARILVASTDGVGTKIKTAKMAGKLNIIGEDIVNHCVDDIAVHNATPLFFLDYIASGKLQKEELSQIITGVVKACKENSCALIGGETAEMPGVYKEGMLDLAGTIVGILNKDEVINGRAIKKGDVLIGIGSNGLHTNGFSLVNKLFFETNDFKISQFINELGDTLDNLLLTPHLSYLPLIKNLVKEIPINGISHITGGGIHDNTVRIIPKGLKLQINYDDIDILPIFNFIQKTGDIKTEEMFRVFNMGVGLIIITEESHLEAVRKAAQELLNKKAKIIGKVV